MNHPHIAKLLEAGLPDKRTLDFLIMLSRYLPTIGLKVEQLTLEPGDDSGTWRIELDESGFGVIVGAPVSIPRDRTPYEFKTNRDARHVPGYVVYNIVTSMGTRDQPPDVDIIDVDAVRTANEALTSLGILHCVYMADRSVESMQPEY